MKAHWDAIDNGETRSAACAKAMADMPFQHGWQGSSQSVGNAFSILIQPGYFKSPAIWSQNNRLATVTARFSDGSSRQLNFNDIMQSQKIDVGSIKTRWVRLVIESVYYGSDPDTAISEVAFEWD